MFREDELAMIRAERAAWPRWRRNLSRGIKILFWLGVLVLVCLIVLSRMGGRGDALKRGLEQYLTQATGMTAHIGYLNHMAFYPLAGMDFDDLTLDPGKRAKGGGHVGHAIVVMRFWDLLLSRPALAALVVEDVDFGGGVFDSRPLAHGRMAIDATTATPRLRATGIWGGQPLDAAIDLRRRGITFMPASPAAFTLSLGDTKLTGTAQFGRGGAGTTVQFTLPSSRPPAQGTLTVRPSKGRQLVQFHLQAGAARLDLDLSRAPGEAFGGKAVFDADATEAAGLVATTARLSRVIPGWPGLKAVVTGKNATLFCGQTLAIHPDGTVDDSYKLPCPRR